MYPIHGTSQRHYRAERWRIAQRERSLRIAADRGHLKLDAAQQRRLQGYNDLKVGDIIEAYKTVETKRKLES